jgi:hypothetical protein
MIETLSLTLGALLAAIISGATGFGFALRHGDVELLSNRARWRCWRWCSRRC